MNNGNNYITPLTINVPADVEYFLKECDASGLDLYRIVDAICDENATISMGEVTAALVYESSNT